MDNKRTGGPDYLVLVNCQHPFDEAFLDMVELEDFINIHDRADRIEKKTNEAVLRLIDRLKEEGLVFGRGGVFRTIEQQQAIMARFIRDKGEDYAHRYVCDPGHSEHHTGLAVDLMPYVDGAWRSDHKTLFAVTEMFARVHELLWEYGFILRYPQGKEAITGVSYEPWHIRYVGIEAAGEIYERKITLEEYLKEN